MVKWFLGISREHSPQKNFFFLPFWSIDAEGDYLSLTRPVHGPLSNVRVTETGNRREKMCWTGRIEAIYSWFFFNALFPFPLSIFGWRCSLFFPSLFPIDQSWSNLLTRWIPLRYRYRYSKIEKGSKIDWKITGYVPQARTFIMHATWRTRSIRLLSYTNGKGMNNPFWHSFIFLLFQLPRLLFCSFVFYSCRFSRTELKKLIQPNRKSCLSLLLQLPFHRLQSANNKVRQHILLYFIPVITNQ